MAWREIVPNEIWWQDSFLDNDTMSRLLRELRTSNRRVFDGRSRPHAVGNTHYNYDLIDWNVRKDAELVSEVFGKINLLMESIGERSIDATAGMNQLQFFAKCFSHDSRYDLHAESKGLFGGYVFVNYLTDEIGGELVFPDRDTAEAFLRHNEDNREGWEQTKANLLAEGDAVRYVGHVEISPSANGCVLFRTGSAHWVNPVISSRNRLVRPTLTGWPQAGREYMEWAESRG